MMSRYDMGHRQFFGHPWATKRGPFQIFDHHYGWPETMGMVHHYQPIIPYQYYDRPWAGPHDLTGSDSGSSKVEMNKNGFKMTVDVKHFKPEEITVKQVEDSVVVEAKHEETEDEYGYASRNFLRRYTLPEGVDPQAINSTLSSDGVLTITAPKVQQMDEENVHTIPIKQTGTPAIRSTGKKPSRK